MFRKTSCSLILILAQCLVTQSSKALECSRQISACTIQKSQNLDPTPYILPSNHKLRPILDSLFPSQEVIRNEKTFAKAGFITIKAQKVSGIRVAKHPNMPGYIIKLYLNSQELHRADMTQQNWLIQRCRGAAQFRELIQKNQIKYFTAPDKWLYELPKKPGEQKERTFVIVETYMHLVSKEQTVKALKKKITKRHLEELILFIKKGGAPGFRAFHLNSPYTKEGKFAFIDTEYPDRVFPPKRVKKIGRFFSKRMRNYWEHLVDQNM